CQPDIDVIEGEPESPVSGGIVCAIAEVVAVDGHHSGYANGIGHGVGATDIDKGAGAVGAVHDDDISTGGGYGYIQVEETARIGVVACRDIDLVAGVRHRLRRIYVDGCIVQGSIGKA